MNAARWLLGAVLLGCAACSSDAADVGDCQLDFRFGGATYVLPSADVRDPVAPKTTSIGTATTPVCDAAGSREQTPVFAYPGVSPRIAITDEQGNVGVRRGATVPPQILRSLAPTQS